MELNRGENLYPYDIVVASPNAALDSYYLLPGLQIGAVNRADQVYHTAGGKGNNLARAVRALDGRVLSLGLVGGYTGKFIVDELAREKIPFDMVWVDQETRRSSTLISPGKMQNTVVLDTGNPIAGEAGVRLRQKIQTHAREAPFLVLTGSLPPGLNNDLYAEIARDIVGIAGLHVSLDCSGPVLQSALEAGAKIVKVNASEYLISLSTGHELDLNEVQQTFAHFQPHGIELLIVTDGPHGAYVFSDRCSPFLVKTDTQTWLSTAGAGDTFMAGLLLSLTREDDLEKAAVFASAAAVASLREVVCGSLDPQVVASNLSRTEIRPIFQSV